MKKLILFSLLLSLFAWGCAKDDEHDHGDEGPYFVTIEIQNPEEGATFPVDQPVWVKVVFDREEDALIHNVLIQVTDPANTVVEKLFEFHIHESGPYTWESDNFVPTAPGAYKLQAITTDMAGESPNLKEVAFVVE
jgi:hypothetical protein